MKKIILILGIVLFISCKSKKVVETPKPAEVTFAKLMLSNVSELQKDKAYELGKRVLMTCNTSKFKPFNESEATASVIQNTTEERLTKTCTKFRQYYGTFKDLQLVEIYKNYFDKSLIFRYKALYTKKVANKELRVSLNEENKVSAIKSLDWTDNFQVK
ncbi:hypothetical protein [Flavobacterium xinjiangense]|uniref:Uncharacterized protein n=1 Tax=Flavobacterium xinjiangense TaxID=178356 RepID=A0A1M7NAR8_9FLAO|nr:hypothetical protein [Flavobacterium xinjiangense]SHN00175.1 hypothetical protein SAMN05216269_11075 [Flavobacterium xinjiangense]